MSWDARRRHDTVPQLHEGVITVVEAFDAVDVIRMKRDRETLSPEAIDWVIDAYTYGRVADEQMSALLMAILLRGMEPRETARWTRASPSSTRPRCIP